MDRNSYRKCAVRTGIKNKLLLGQSRHKQGMGRDNWCHCDKWQQLSLLQIERALCGSGKNWKLVIFWFTLLLICPWVTTVTKKKLPTYVSGNNRAQKKNFSMFEITVVLKYCGTCVSYLCVFLCYSVNCIYGFETNRDTFCLTLWSYQALEVGHFNCQNLCEVTRSVAIMS